MSTDSTLLREREGAGWMKSVVHGAVQPQDELPGREWERQRWWVGGKEKAGTEEDDDEGEPYGATVPVRAGWE